MSKQDSLVKGTLILALAAFVARFLGIAQRVPLYYVLGKTGNAWFGLSNSVYLTLLPIATAGIPSALSKLVAEKTALGRQAEAEQIFRFALRFAVIAGLVIMIPLVVLAPYLAHISGLPEATLSIWAISPALLIFPVIAMLRGYFQGRQMMMAGGLSQIWEQILRVITAVMLAALLAAGGAGMDWVSAGASFGGVFGAVAALLVMIYYLRKLRRSDAQEKRGAAPASSVPTKIESGKIFRNLLKLSIPISLYSSTVSLINTIDNMIGVPLLQGHYVKEQAVKLVGILSGQAQSLAGISVVFAIAVSQSLVPVISAAHSRGDHEEVKRKGKQALMLAMLSGLLVVAIMTAGADPLNRLLFSDTEGSGIIALLSAVTIFQIMMMTSGAVLMGMGRMKMLIYNLLVCVGVKLVFSWLLAIQFDMYGMILATGLCYLASTIMNLLYLRREIGFVFLGRRWAGMALTTAALIAAGFGVEWLNRSMIHLFSGNLLADKINDLVQTAVVCLVMLAVYGVMLFGTRVITVQELSSLPGPLQKLVKRFPGKKTMSS